MESKVEFTKDGWASVDNWLSRLRSSTADVSRWHIGDFMGWLGEKGGDFACFTPDMLVAYQQNATNSERFKILDLIQKYVLERPGRQGYKKKRYTYLRSFFLHNRADLPRDKSFNIRGDMAKVQGTLTPEEVKLIILSCNRQYRTAYLCMFQGAMDQDMFTYWNEVEYEKLIKDLAGLEANPQREPTVKVDLPGRKGMKFEKPYYSFLARDSIEALRDWLKHRPAKAKAIIVNRDGSPMTKSGLKTYWVRHARKLGLMNPREGRDKRIYEGKNTHELRDVFRSLWSKSPAKYEVGEYFMGHNVDELEYDKSFRDVDFYRKQYELTAPYLNLLSSGRAFGQVGEDEVERLRDELTNLRSGENREIADLRKIVEKQGEIIELLMEKTAKILDKHGIQVP
jgi:integrase